MTFAVLVSGEVRGGETPLPDLTKGTTPISPPSGPATSSFNGLHRESNFLTFINRVRSWKMKSIYPEGKPEEKNQAREDPAT